MAYSDVYGAIVDSDTIEQAFKDSLQAFLPVNLRTQEERLGLAAETLPDPKSWPVVSEFDIRPHEQLPAIIVSSPGHGSPAHDRGVYRVPWRLEVAVAIGDTTESAARRLASIYIAAVIGAALDDRTLEGIAETTVWTGPGDQAIGTVDTGGQRAIYGTSFEVTVSNTIPRVALPRPEDPGTPPDAPQTSLEAEFIVTAVAPEDTP